MDIWHSFLLLLCSHILWGQDPCVQMRLWDELREYSLFSDELDQSRTCGCFRDSSFLVSSFSFLSAQFLDMISALIRLSSSIS
uniref:Uncharacterized protein n=1 Tax=Nelumbo nucifera TaxID=4432 RepID=A0A822ZGN6_NELNU|nr:TPA_asm: hypothetical protein HUJ06_015141 [Nelumbo nucifera]